MDDKHKYKEIVKHDDDKTRPINKKPVNLIKSANVVRHEPVVIKVNAELIAENGQSTIQPIIEDGIVVGIFYRCACGRTEKIRFVYED